MSAALSHLSEEEFLAFADLFHRHTGIRFGRQKRYFVDKRLHDRAEKSGAKNYGAYIRRLASDPSELQEVVEALTVNETYFFREEEQLDLIVSQVVPKLAETRTGLRLACLPCSTGEEPYSLAIKLLEGWPGVDRHEITLLGLDIDREVLGRAKAALYSQRSVQRLPKGLLSKYFRRDASGYQLIPDLRGSVDFRVANLLDGKGLAALGPLDLVLCRNVLIYFDVESRARAAAALAAAIGPGGALVLAASETLEDAARYFDLERRRGLTIHWRRGGGR